MAMLTMDKQKALMRGFSGTHKVKLWNAKYRTLLDEVDFTNEEKQHLQKLFMFLKPKHYDTKEGFAELQNFVRKWQKDAEKNLNWSEKEFFLYTSTLYTIDEINAYLTEIKEKNMGGGDDCECIYSIYCVFAKGSSYAYCDTDAICSAIAECGIVGTSNCKGICVD